MRGSLKHASSRKLLLKGGKVVKFYPRFYGFLLHETTRMIFQMLSGVHRIDFVSGEMRLRNEIRGRNVLASMRVKSTRIISFSIKNRFLEEEFEKNSQDMGDIESKNVKLALKLSQSIGKITRRLNDRGFYFIDNRANNWLVKDSRDILRTDLELFRKLGHDENKDFYAKCDYLSFISSVRSSMVKACFINGYEKQIRHSIFTEFVLKLYIKLTDKLFS